jgi:hypothetical protein
LHFEQLVERVKGFAVPGCAGKALHHALDGIADGRLIAAQCDEPALQVFLGFIPLRDLLVGRIVSVRL